MQGRHAGWQRDEGQECPGTRLQLQLLLLLPVRYAPR